MKLVERRPRSYRVPERFSIAAVLAFMTGFGLLFGALRLFDAPAFLYLFLGCEALVISVAQMIFKTGTRLVSILAGAVMLPLWVVVVSMADRVGRRPTVWDLLQAMDWDRLLWSLPWVAVAGGVLGYCTGAFAAGIFLVLDKLAPRPAMPTATFGNQDDASGDFNVQ